MNSKVEQSTKDKWIPPNAGKGRVRGVPNKATSIVRDAIANLLERNADKMDEWLQLVACGDEDKGLKPAPDKALDIMQKMAEYHIPKLARTELTGADGGDVKVSVKWANSHE
jgi:hypothetical protein